MATRLPGTTKLNECDIYDYDIEKLDVSHSLVAIIVQIKQRVLASFTVEKQLATQKYIDRN